MCSPFCPAERRNCRTAVSHRSARGGRGGISFPSRAAWARWKIHGLPKQPRPIMAMSAPVYRRIWGASSGSNTSPLAMTGMFTASFTARM